MILQRFNVGSYAALLVFMTKAAKWRNSVKLTKDTGVKVYFAHPHSPWERGQNDNTNGLLRHYLSKGSDFSIFFQQALDDIAWKFNTHPRKSLNWKCLAEPFLPEGVFDFKAYWTDKLNLVALGH